MIIAILQDSKQSIYINTFVYIFKLLSLGTGSFCAIEHIVGVYLY